LLNSKKLKQMVSLSKMEIHEMVVLVEVLQEAALDRNFWYLH
jgi:hypothetical protein